MNSIEAYQTDLIDLTEEDLVLSDDNTIKECEEKLKWVEDALNGSSKAKNAIYKQYYKMVKTLVYNFFTRDGNNYSSSILEMEDYEQEAWCYLFKNLNKYDPTRSKLSTFIYMRTEACLQRYRENNARTIRYPVYKVQLFNKMKKFCTEYEYNNLGFPSNSLLMKEFNVTQSEINQFSEYIGVNLISLEQNLYDSDDKNTFHSVLDAGIDIEKNSFSAILMEEIENKIFTSKQLANEDKELIKFWLFDEISDKEICSQLNIKKNVLNKRKEHIKTILQELLIDLKATL